MMDEVAAALAAMKRADRKPPANFIFITDPPSGLRAFLVLDSLALGPAAGGVRTRRYPSAESALRDALDLARAMTLKCALAGLDAGGGKCVVMDHEGLDRPRAFEHLGRRIEALRGAFRTAGDLGTTKEDLEAMARGTRYVYLDERGLTSAVARGMLRCIEACAAERGRKDVAGMRVAIQGAGSIGSAVAEALSNEGA
ncbi:MAG TPA: Glu/Leu/Phe/Val dehydrogenase dimerization domain-containing protein, partial [Polyangiaceae bacterium]|nr:Glu/Leu/Phe/Val dehydrogenase dimerization domain-containing protein [Polyangiaceae bacterium]